MESEKLLIYPSGGDLPNELVVFLDSEAIDQLNLVLYQLVVNRSTNDTFNAIISKVLTAISSQFRGSYQ